MARLRTLVPLGSLLVLYILCIQSASSCTTPTELKNHIDVLIDGTPALTRTSPGIMIQQFNQTSRLWQTLYSLRASQYHTPASNNKVLTTAAIITSLGPSWSIKTPVYAKVNGRSVPSMCIQGKGDPTMGPEALDNLVAALKLSHVSSINELILDASYFQPQFPAGWSWGDLTYYYGASPSSFILNENTVNVHVSPGSKIGDPVKITFDSPADATLIQVDTSRTTTKVSGTADIDLTWELGRPESFIIGSMPIGAAPVPLTMAVQQPTQRFAGVLVYKLNAAGINVKDVKFQNCQGSDLYYVWTSQSLNDIVNRTLQVSDNVFAEVLCRTLGALAPGTGSVNSKGITAISQILGSIGVDTSSFRQVDGSGLDSANLIAPEGLIATFKAMSYGRYADEYKSYLPSSKPGGALFKRFGGTPAESRVFAKTGYISLVSSLSGWVDSDKLFSILLDQSNTPKDLRTKIIDQIVLMVADLCPLK